MSLEDREDVPSAKSCISASATLKFRPAASHAIAAPLMPQPMTKRSNDRPVCGFIRRFSFAAITFDQEIDRLPPLLIGGLTGRRRCGLNRFASPRQMVELGQRPPAARTKSCHQGRA